eukprot:6206116-Pleurochrysis_carterae.AAC.1
MCESLGGSASVRAVRAGPSPAPASLMFIYPHAFGILTSLLMDFASATCLPPDSILFSLSAPDSILSLSARARSSSRLRVRMILLLMSRSPPPVFSNEALIVEEALTTCLKRSGLSREKRQATLTSQPSKEMNQPMRALALSRTFARALCASAPINVKASIYAARCVFCQSFHTKVCVQACARALLRS